MSQQRSDVVEKRKKKKKHLLIRMHKSDWWSKTWHPVQSKETRQLTKVFRVCWRKRKLTCFISKHSGQKGDMPQTWLFSSYGLGWLESTVLSTIPGCGCSSGNKPMGIIIIFQFTDRSWTDRNSTGSVVLVTFSTHQQWKKSHTLFDTQMLWPGFLMR